MGEPAHHATHAHHTHGDPSLVARGWTREEGVRVLDRPERRSTEDPDALWARLELPPGAVVAEVGAGTGFYAIPAARRVGPTGRVYAIDVSAELVALLDERRHAFRLPQLVPVRSSLTEIPLGTGIADVVLLANVLHDLPPAIIGEAVRLLKPEGTFVNLDWGPSAGPVGPPVEVRLSPEAAERVLASYGLRRVGGWDPGPWHYLLTLRRAHGSPHA